MAKTHTVTGAAVVITDDTGKIRYYYQGAVLPSDLPDEEIKRLTDAGMIGSPDVFVAATPGTVAVGPSTTVSSSPALDPADAPTVKSRK